jgi:hypothetical protein
MAGQAFDDLAKALATGASRRTVLKTFGVGLVGTLASALLPHSAEAQVPPVSPCSVQCEPNNKGFTCTRNSNKEFRCGPTSGQCTCFETIENGKACGQRQCFCESLIGPCTSSAQCGPGFFCAKRSCCQRAKLTLAGPVQDLPGHQIGQVCIPCCGDSCPQSTTPGVTLPVV